MQVHGIIESWLFSEQRRIAGQGRERAEQGEATGGVQPQPGLVRSREVLNDTTEWSFLRQSLVFCLLSLSVIFWGISEGLLPTEDILQTPPEKVTMSRDFS